MTRFPLPSVTAYTHIETRAYEMFNKRLGRDGVRRSIVKFAFAIGGPWLFLMWVIVGDPLGQLWLYLLPPAIAVVLLTRQDKGGRLTYLALYDRIRYLLRRSRRLIPSPGRGVQGAAHQHIQLHLELHAVNARRTR